VSGVGVGSLFKLKIFGAEIRIDRSWTLFSLLLCISLATMFFPYYYKKLQIAIYWWSALVATVGFFLSILFHELSHIYVSRFTSRPHHFVTLHQLGGIVHSGNDNSSIPQEIFIALTGPVASFALALFWHLILILGKEIGTPVEILGIFDFLRLSNLFIATFHLLPVYPLDGGRIIRVLFWKISGNLSTSTRISTLLSAASGLLLISGGVVLLSSGVPVGGLWCIVIGLFLQKVSRLSYLKYSVRKVLEGERISKFMTSCPLGVPGSISLNRFVNDYLYKKHLRMFPVVDDDGRLVGCISSRDIMTVSSEERTWLTVYKKTVPCTPWNTIRDDADTVVLLAMMNSTGQSRIMVVDREGGLCGMIVLKDLLKFFSVKL